MTVSSPPHPPSPPPHPPTHTTTPTASTLFRCASLQGFPLPTTLRASNDIHEVAAYGEVILMVIPTPFVERTVTGVGGEGGEGGGRGGLCDWKVSW